jgi:uncharacterized membrane protein
MPKIAGASSVPLSLDTEHDTAAAMKLSVKAVLAEMMATCLFV